MVINPLVLGQLANLFFCGHLTYWTDAKRCFGRHFRAKPGKWRHITHLGTCLRSGGLIFFAKLCYQLSAHANSGRRAVRTGPKNTNPEDERLGHIVRTFANLIWIIWRSGKVLIRASEKNARSNIMKEVTKSTRTLFLERHFENGITGCMHFDVYSIMYAIIR